MYIDELGWMLVGDDWGSKLEMIHDTSRLNDQLQQDSSQSSSFAAYETASVRTRIGHRYHLFKVTPSLSVNLSFHICHLLLETLELLRAAP